MLSNVVSLLYAKKLMLIETAVTQWQWLAELCNPEALPLELADH